MTKTNKAFGGCAVAACFIFFTSGAQAFDGTMSAEGARSGKLGGDRFLSIRYEVKSPRDVGSGVASGRRQHGPVCVTRATSATSPKYFSALVTNEVLKNATFEGANGYKITLTNATVSTYALVGNDSKDQEEICFTFQKIEISAKGATATDDWSSRN